MAQPTYRVELSSSVCDHDEGRLGPLDARKTSASRITLFFKETPVICAIQQESYSLGHGTEFAVCNLYLRTHG
jgi:hypothetical protein